MALYRRIVESQLSVREVEAWPDWENASTGPNWHHLPPEERTPRGRQTARATASGTRVAVKESADGKGRIEIAFRNAEELERLTRLLGE